MILSYIEGYHRNQEDLFIYLTHPSGIIGNISKIYKIDIDTFGSINVTFSDYGLSYSILESGNYEGNKIHKPKDLFNNTFNDIYLLGNWTLAIIDYNNERTANQFNTWEQWCITSLCWYETTFDPTNAPTISPSNSPTNLPTNTPTKNICTFKTHNEKTMGSSGDNIHVDPFI